MFRTYENVYAQDEHFQTLWKGICRNSNPEKPYIIVPISNGFDPLGKRMFWWNHLFDKLSKQTDLGFYAYIVYDTDEHKSSKLNRYGEPHRNNLTDNLEIYPTIRKHLTSLLMEYSSCLVIIYEH
jgi:hypothetical protein